MASGILAALWLLGLFAAAPVLSGSRPAALADRLRDAIILGIAIVFALGFVHALYPASCWIVLASCVLVAHRSTILRRTREPNVPELAPETRGDRPPYVLIAALALIAWPPLMRPLLDGDSLSYHLPNAAAWVHAHGLWTTDARYWWYPPASELFAAGLFAVSGGFAVGWSGFAALALLGFRIEQWSRVAFGLPPWLSDLLAAAVATISPLALQAGSLQNDVFLAAFFLESLYALQTAPAVAIRTIAVTALVKPYGWAFALIAAAVSRAPKRVWAAGFAAIALWVLHDAILWNHAIVSAASASTANTWQSTILAHAPQALALLVRVAALASPAALAALAAATFGPWISGRQQRALGWAALAALLAFLAMPLAFSDTRAQLATGASLRYAAPALALGGLLLARPARRAPVVAGWLFALCAAVGCSAILATYWNDGGTRSALAIALLTVANVALAGKLRVRWPLPAGFGLAVVATTALAMRHPVDYYADAMRVDGRASGVYAWIARAQPPALGGWGLRLGIVNVLAPQTRTLDLPDATACAAASQQRVLLAAVAQNDRPPALNARRLRDARACARTLRYDDGLAVVGKVP